MSIYIFDFDGVLAIPWTQPEIPFPNVIVFLRDLHSTGKKLCLASYNPAAVRALESWGVSNLFTAMRAGSNKPWSGNYTEEYRIGMSKSKQIKDMLVNELYPHKAEDCVFFDDTIENIALVNRELPQVHTILIDTIRGLGQFF